MSSTSSTSSTSGTSGTSSTSSTSAMNSMSATAEDIRPFTVAVSQESLDDLKQRLDRTRWTSDIPGEGADYGTSLDLIHRPVEYWRDGYDWRAFEARLNQH